MPEKKILYFIVIYCGILSNLNSQELSTNENKGIKRFIELVKKQNIPILANHVSYPLTRKYPIEPIRNKKEFIERYHHIFDQELIRKIVQSNMNNDWSKAGWRGIMLNQGDLWINKNGHLIAVNHFSNYEKKLTLKLIELDKKSLYKTLLDYEKLILKGLTKKERFRIDLLKDQKYRYASWKINKTMKGKPDLIIENGLLIIEGSISNEIYEFKNNDYKYIISDEEVRGKNSKVMTIYKMDSEVLKEIVSF